MDGLHLAAGSRRVLEVHGQLRAARCTGCGALVAMPEVLALLGAGPEAALP